MHSNNPLVTIITITYNSDKTLRNTILSVLNSKYPRIQYILIDNLSSDQTLKIANEFKNSFTDMIIISEKDKGISDAFNKGIKHSKGELIGILNSDDQYHPNTITNAVNSWLQGHQIVMGDVVKMNKRLKSSIINIRKKNTIMHPSCFISSETYEKIGPYNTELKFAMDYDLLIRAIKADINLFYNQNVLTYMSNDGISNSGIKNAYKSLKEAMEIQVTHGCLHLYQAVSNFCFRFIKVLIIRILRG